MPSRKPIWVSLKGTEDAASLKSQLGMQSLPFDVREALSRIGVVVKEVESPGWFGALTQDSSTGEAYVWLDSSMSERKKRFVMAFELGNLLLHEEKEFRDGDFEQNSDEKRASSKFAQELLMPSAFVEMCIQNRLSIEETANLFLTTTYAASVRRSQFL